MEIRQTNDPDHQDEPAFYKDHDLDLSDCSTCYNSFFANNLYHLDELAVTIISFGRLSLLSSVLYVNIPSNTCN